MLAHALLVCLLVPVADVDKKDIQCQDSGQYIGGINRDYRLKVSGPKDKKWEYAFSAMGAGDVKLNGTYELVDDLAVFTGKTAKGDEVRFGLNYGFPGDKVEFNGFFPDSDKTLRYHRKWFKKVNGEWKPAEEITLSMPRTPLDGKEWKVPMQGEHVRWEGVKATRTKIDETLIYQGQGLTKPQGRLPVYLMPRVIDRRLDAVFPDQRGSSNPQGMLRGFSPHVATEE
ncbi:MAG: hypothetical protein K2R98_27970 [Gemmataceae bacterium]|nr:hypothetical protein [Gemmataceae bacterium]